MTIRKYIGHVQTSKVGSRSEFEFEVDDEDMPEDPAEMRKAIDKVAHEAMYESGVFEWGYNEVAE